MLEVCEDKKTCHTKFFIWTQKDGKLAQMKTNITFVLTFVKMMPESHCHCKNNHTKHDFWMKKHSKIFFGEKLHMTSDYLGWRTKLFNENKWTRTSSWGWLLQRWCQQQQKLITVTKWRQTSNWCWIQQEWWQSPLSLLKPPHKTWCF